MTPLRVAVTVPTYTTNTTRDHQHIITDSGAPPIGPSGGGGFGGGGNRRCFSGGGGNNEKLNTEVRRIGDEEKEHTGKLMCMDRVHGYSITRTRTQM